VDQEDKNRIYEEEKARLEANERIKSEEKAKKKKKGFIGCLSVIVLIVLIVLIAGKCSAPQSQNASVPSANEAWQKAEINEDSVKAALIARAPRIFKDNITKINVSDNLLKQGQKTISLHYKLGTVMDDTDLVRTAGSNAISACSELFQNPKVEMVELFAETDMTDQYGKTSLQVGVKIVYDREVVNKIDWKGLSVSSASDPGNIYRIAKGYYIHPGILKNVKSDIVKLK